MFRAILQLCEPVSPTEMHCPIPPVPPPEGFPFSQSPSDVDQPQVFDVDVYIGFWLDGVEQYRDMRDVDPDGAQILIYYNPELDDFSEPQRIRAFKPYPPHNHESIEIVVSTSHLAFRVINKTYIKQVYAYHYRNDHLR